MLVILKLSCPDRVGLLARITGFCADRGINLLEVHQFTDADAGWFFSRIEMDLPIASDEYALFREEVALLGEELSAEWTMHIGGYKQRVALMVSRAGHCLADLLWRWRSNDLPMDLVGVISNHHELEAMVVREGLPFVHIPVVPTRRDEAFDAVEKQLNLWDAESVVLARYMQVIPRAMCERFNGRMINIHHSFLPSFAGAEPYLQAYQRGVKLIGATCHYVTADLDAGPIIEQEVVRTEHFHHREDLLRLGQDCERLALARGLRYHLADRVFIHNNKTVVFRD